MRNQVSGAAAAPGKQSRAATEKNGGRSARERIMQSCPWSTHGCRLALALPFCGQRWRHVRTPAGATRGGVVASERASAGHRADAFCPVVGVVVTATATGRFFGAGVRPREREGIQWMTGCRGGPPELRCREVVPVPGRASVGRRRARSVWPAAVDS